MAQPQANSQSYLEQPDLVREAKVSSGVSFLQHEKVCMSPLSQRLSFLEEKGLTPTEVQEVLKRFMNSNDIEGIENMHRKEGGNERTLINSMLALCMVGMTTAAGFVYRKSDEHDTDDGKESIEEGIDTQSIAFWSSLLESIGVHNMAHYVSSPDAPVQCLTHQDIANVLSNNQLLREQLTDIPFLSHQPTHTTKPLHQVDYTVDKFCSNMRRELLRSQAGNVGVSEAEEEEMNGQLCLSDNLITFNVFLKALSSLTFDDKKDPIPKNSIYASRKNLLEALLKFDENKQFPSLRRHLKRMDQERAEAERIDETNASKEPQSEVAPLFSAHSSIPLFGKIQSLDYMSAEDKLPLLIGLFEVYHEDEMKHSKSDYDIINQQNLNLRKDLKELQMKCEKLENKLHSIESVAPSLHDEQTSEEATKEETQTLENLIHIIESENEALWLREALPVLKMFTSKIMNEPKNPRVRRIPTSNALYSQHVPKTKGGVELLQYAGFKPKGSYLEFETALGMSAIKDVVDALMELEKRLESNQITNNTENSIEETSIEKPAETAIREGVAGEDPRDHTRAAGVCSGAVHQHQGPTDAEVGIAGQSCSKTGSSLSQTGIGKKEGRNSNKQRKSGR